MSWTGRKVLVTGAGGFIGSHLCEELVRRGARPRAFVHYNALGSLGWLDSSDLRDQIDPYAGDITDANSVREGMSECEVVFHLAALIAIPYSYRAPMSYIRTNIDGTTNVLQAARELGTGRVVHTSTSEVYGTAITVPITESHPLQGQSPYSASKIGADKMVEAYVRSFGVRAVTLRPFNTFGPRQSARAVIPTIVTQCLAGETVSLGSLTPTRDLNYVSNTVEAFLAAGETPGIDGETINAGSGREISIGDLVSLIAKIVGKEVRVVTQPERLRPAASEVERLVADSARAKALMGWAPRITLEEGLERTVEWMISNVGKYRPNAYTI